jgi:peroxiredoxin
LSDRREEFEAKGAGIVAIGMGRPEMAAHFRDERDVPFPLIVDHDKKTYKALELKRGNLWDMAGPQNWLRYTKGILAGHGVAAPKQDPSQMGGVVVVEAGGKIVYVHRGEIPADNPMVDEVLEAVP